MKFLMVCLGNICRSPLAEGILKEKAKQNGLDWEVASAGTSAYHAGELPDQRSIHVAQVHGLDITDQRSQQIKKSDLDTYDVVYVMDSSNYNNVLALCSNDSQKAKVKMIMNEVEPGMNIGVPDPYWGNDGFEQVYQMLDAASEQVVAKYQ